MNMPTTKVSENFKECIDCTDVINPGEMYVDYKIGPMCMSCYTEEYYID